MLQEGIEAQYLSETPAPCDATGRVARRKATYAQGIGEASTLCRSHGTDQSDRVGLPWLPLGFRLLGELIFANR